MSDAALAAVVLNHRTAALACACVDALVKGGLRPEQVLVVDNGSGDGGAEVLAAHLGEARLLRAAENRGFSAGVNLGLARALAQGAARVLLLNADLAVAPDTVGRLAAALDADPGLGVVGPVVLQRDDPGRIESDGIRWNAATGRVLHPGFGRRYVAAERAGVRPVDALSGACLLVDRAVFERIGTFAEPYFFTFEDLDFCLRARAAGFRPACVDGAVVFHQGGASLAVGTPRRAYFAMRNHLALAREHGRGRGLAVAARGLRIVALNAAQVLLRGRGPRLAGLGGAARGLADYLLGRSGPGR